MHPLETPQNLPLSQQVKVAISSLRIVSLNRGRNLSAEMFTIRSMIMPLRISKAVFSIVSPISSLIGTKTQERLA